MIALHDTEATFHTRQMILNISDKVAIQEIGTKYGEFQETSKILLIERLPTRYFLYTIYTTTYPIC
jgi:hypothetical protein